MKVAVIGGGIGGQLDQDTLDAYRKYLTADPQRRSIQVAHLLEVVVDLHHFREHVPSGGITLLRPNRLECIGLR